MTRSSPHLVEVGLRWPPETFIARKLEGLAGAGFRVTVVAAVDRSRERARLDGVDLVELPPAETGRLGRGLGALRDCARLLLRDPRRLRRTVAVLRSADGGTPWRRIPASLAGYLPILLARPDVVHFEWESAAVRSLPLFDACGCPVTMSVRGSGIHVHPHAGYARLTAAYPLVFERAAAVHCVSEAVREEAARFGLERSKARVIHSAVDPELFSPAADRGRGEGDLLRVVAVGELNWIKGYDFALAAIASLARAGVAVSYEIAGGEPEAGSGKVSDRARLLYLIHDLGIGDRVRLLGALSQEAVRERLRGSDVLLQASLSEGLPNTVLEAMACALPVVVSDCGGLREAVEDGVEGFVCERRSPAALADALARLARDPQLARRLGEAGRRRVLSQFTLAGEMDSWLRLYEETTGLSPAR